MLALRTQFRAPDSYDSVVLEQEGSRLIRQRVFDKILEEEKTAQPAKEKISYDILPDNYLHGISMCSVPARSIHSLRYSCHFHLPKYNSAYPRILPNAHLFLRQKAVGHKLWYDIESAGSAAPNLGQ